MRPLLAAVVFAFSAASLLAARFDVMAAGEPVPDAEICIASIPADGTFVQKLFATSDLRCSSASGEIDLGAGKWQVIARKGNDLVSASALVMTAEDAKRGSRHKIDVVAAGTLDLSRWDVFDGERRFIYVTSTAAAIPLDREAVVPAGVTLVPLAVKTGEITFVGGPLTISAGSREGVERKPRGEDRTDLVVPVTFQSLPDGKAEPPAFIAIDAKGREHRPAIAPGIPGAPGTSLLFFRHLSIGSGKVQLSGRRWKAATADVAALDRPVTTLHSGLDAQTTTKLIVHWWTPVDLATFRPPITPDECKAVADPFQRPPSERLDGFLAVLSRCRDPRKPADPGTPRCVEIGRRNLPENELRGTIEFEDVAAGDYSLSFSYRDLPPVSMKATARPLEISEMDAEIRYVTFFGTVTRGGDPLHATVFGATSDPDTGRYVAVMTRLPGPYPQAVSPCDGSSPYRFVPLDPPRENVAFDIDVPMNKIDVDVTDAKTGLPVKEAVITLAAIKDEKERSAHFAGPFGKADEKGHLTVGPVLTNQKLLICARHDDYAAKCAESFEMGETREKTLHFALDRITKRYGQVQASGPFTNGEVIWFDLTGKVTELIRKFEPDGRFAYTRTHGPDEIVVVSSSTTPLFIFRHPQLRDDQVFDISIPAGRVRSLTIRLSDRWPGKFAWGTVQIGDLVVPINALAWHLRKRQSVISTTVTPGGSLLLSDLLETGPITAILVIPPGASIGDGDYAYAPERAAFPRQLVGDRTEVVFEP